MFQLPNLKYDYESLDKYIGVDIMRLHHDKHHQAYVDKLNLTVQENPEIQGKSVEALLTSLDLLPESVRQSVRNNGGGHYNHSFFWLCMSPDSSFKPNTGTANLITDKYGSLQNFIDEFTKKALSVFGSGWVWLLLNGDIITTPNQDTPIGMGLQEPILCLDVWEHAYYLDYKNRRDEYIKAWWNVVDWNYVESRYQAHQK